MISLSETGNRLFSYKLTAHSLRLILIPCNTATNSIKIISINFIRYFNLILFYKNIFFCTYYTFRLECSKSHFHIKYLLRIRVSFHLGWDKEMTCQVLLVSTTTIYWNETTTKSGMTRKCGLRVRITSA